ncbi:unnamed protein product [Caenorhabditis angaria]|uniref:Uncharacterized protein n=1 Tax=Caenorhabditis angaria TaxID=860376 RepID=A0A9P1J0G3_9PELO|nr:unnamed protein product [Caenorhabditis angaria]
MTDAKEDVTQMLLKSVEEGRVDILCSILKDSSPSLNLAEKANAICCEDGTVLHRAVQLDSADAVSALLTNGVNPCVQNNQNKTPFMLCKSDSVKGAFIREALQAITFSE